MGDVAGHAQHTNQMTVRVLDRCLGRLVKPPITAVMIGQPFFVSGGRVGLRGDEVAGTKEVAQFLVDEVVISLANDIWLVSAAEWLKRGITKQVYPVGILEPNHIRDGSQQSMQACAFPFQSHSVLFTLLAGFS